MDHESCNCESTPAGPSHGIRSQTPVAELDSRTSVLVNCPAEMENKLTNYETSAKHLVIQHFINYQNLYYFFFIFIVFSTLFINYYIIRHYN